MAAKRKISKKTVNKSSKSVKHSVPHAQHAHIAKSVIPLMILLVAFAVFILFYTYQQSIINTNSFNMFLVLAVIGMGLLITLMFLVNPQKK